MDKRTKLKELIKFLKIAEKKSTKENPAAIWLYHDPEKGWCFTFTFRNHVKHKE